MIRVSVTSLVLLLIGLSAGTVLLLWFMDEVRRRSGELRQKAKIFKCPLCFFEFTPSSQIALPPCPRCGAPSTKT